MATTIDENDLVVEFLQRSRKQERRDFIERIMKDIESGAPNVSWECWQQCPNTAGDAQFQACRTQDRAWIFKGVLA